MILPELHLGDIIQIEWIDICENVTGDLNTAELMKRTSIGIFWGLKESHGIESLVTTTTVDEDPTSSGYCIYPLFNILDVKVVKRKRRKRGPINNPTT